MDYLPEDQVNKDSVQSIFEQAFIDVSRDSDDDIIVEGKSGGTVVFVNDELKEIKLFSQFAPGGLPKRRIYEIVNRINTEYRLCKFMVTDKLVLRIDYSLSFARGIIPYHLIAQYRRYDSVIVQALTEEDYTKGLIK